jgi:hypothetical protein
MEMATLYIDTQYSKTQRKPQPVFIPVGHTRLPSKKAPSQTSRYSLTGSMRDERRRGCSKTSIS